MSAELERDRQEFLAGLTPEQMRLYDAAELEWQHDLDAYLAQRTTHAIAYPSGRRRVARTVIVEDGKVWLYQQISPVETMLPGGGANPGESPEQTAIRETKEETGFEIQIVRWLADFDDEHAQRVYYVARRMSGAPTNRDEDGGHPVSITLVSFAEAHDRLTSPFDRAALEMVEKVGVEAQAVAVNIIRKVGSLYFVYDHTGKKKLSRGYTSHKKAAKRLGEIEWFKKNKK
jgi:ADP-ribose pyrophosphatase YjhB (NUDIX family)